MTTERRPLIKKGSSSTVVVQDEGSNNTYKTIEEGQLNSNEQDSFQNLGNTSLPMIVLCSNLSVWIMTSYMLSTSAIQPLYGKLSDIYGRKSTLVTIICFFLIGSLLCGAAGSMTQLSIARAIAGLGGGGIMTMASVVIHDLVPMRQRGQYQAYVNMAQTIGTTVGAPLGGLINDTLGWRYCFYINIPFCLFILYHYIYKLENYNLQDTKVDQKLEQIDFVGAALLLMANVCFVTSASLGGNTRPWDDPLIIILGVTAATLFTAFGLYEFCGAKYPLICRALIKNRNVMAVCLNNFFLCQSTMTMSYLIPQFFMGILGYNPSSAGLWVFPRSLMVAVGCFYSGRRLTLTGRYKHFINVVMLVHVITAIGTWMWKPGQPLWYYLACMNMEGFIFGLIFVATMVALVIDIHHEETASATSMIFLFRSTGWLSGSTISAAIMQSRFKSYLQQSMKGPEAADVIEFSHLH
ncbi:major facilitator superfamily domain-containing protein [Gilbertella persicaria]|uniref:major facilitator superfamily domain-containing protein n=1 Tax=Gilbertella persicaria TaxID=101096 RepID=UPI00221FB86E|nr:major facilitator superfamily domain-containing protein [Gilbertella persicaria]KAI8077981.1 major facilitator superfamily domain-containing protein [Gilbertella persicaria]